MPRFFFHVHDGANIPDKEGTELGDWRNAQHEAIKLAGRVIADDAKRLRLGEDWSMEVTDETGLVLFRLDFHVSGSAAIMGASFTKGEPT